MTDRPPGDPTDAIERQLAKLSDTLAAQVADIQRTARYVEVQFAQVHAQLDRAVTLLKQSAEVLTYEQQDQTQLLERIGEFLAGLGLEAAEPKASP